MNKQPKEREIRTLPTTEFRIGMAEDGTRNLTGLIPYNSRSADLGGFTELIAPGAFADALTPNADVLCLRDHSASILLGRTKSKTLALTDSPEGLRFSCALPKTTQASDLAESVDRGDLDGTSFGFSTLEDKWTADQSGNVLRTLISVELYEISPCSFAAYPASQANIRSCPAEMRSLIEKRGSAEKRTNDNGCDCDCPECVDNDCMSCSNDECDDANCLLNEERNANLRLQLALAAAL